MNDISQISWIEATEMNAPKEQHSYFDNMLQLLNVQVDRAGWPDQFGDALYSWAKNTLETPIKILSLFSGGGGLDVAFRDAGFHAVQMIELDARYVATLTVNAQAGQRFEGSLPCCMDIRSFSPLESSPVDFIIGVHHAKHSQRRAAGHREYRGWMIHGEIFFVSMYAF